METQQTSVLQENLPAFKGEIFPAKGLPGAQSTTLEPLGYTVDLKRLGVSDENCSPNESRFRERTPDISFDIGLLKSSSESPYSPRSNPFGKRPSQRTPGAIAFVRRLSEVSIPDEEAKEGGMREGPEGKDAWLASPEVSAEAVQSSWDAVGRIEEVVGDQAGSGQSPLPKLPNLAAVQEASHLAELAESELALTWTGTRVKTEEGPASWRKRISNPTFHGTPSPTSSRASSASEPFLNARAGRRDSLGSPAAVDSGVSSPFRTPRGAAAAPPAVSPPTEDALRSSAELFPRSFRIQRTGSSDSLASLLSMTSDITARESSFEAPRGEATALETILEPGETPERSRENRAYFGRVNAGNPAQLVLGVPPQGPPPEGPETPRTQVLRVEGAFASPIEVQAGQGPSVEPPLSLDAGNSPQVEAATASAWLQRQGAATPFAQLRQPSALTPVIRKAQAAHAQAATREPRVRGRALVWSTALLVLQLLLILAPFMLILCAPALLPALPNLGSHPTVSSKAASVSSAATFPGITAGRAAGPAWWKKPWASTVGLFGGAAEKQPSDPMHTAADFLHRLFRHETPQTTHAFFGLLPRASPAAPTPHLDKLLSRAADWWHGVAGRLRLAATGRKLPRKLPPPQPADVGKAALKPSTAAERKTPAQRSLERARDLKPKVSTPPPAPVQSVPVPLTPPPAVAKQVKPQAPPAAAPKQATPPSKPAQQPAPVVAPQQRPPKAKDPAQQEPSKAAAGKGGLQSTGASVGTGASRLAVSASRAAQGLKRGVADAIEGLLLRGRALLPRSFPSLPRAMQAHGQGITAAAAIATLVTVLTALVALVARSAPAQQEPAYGVPAPATPAASIPAAVAPGDQGPRTASRRGRRAAAAGEGPVSPRRGLRQAVPAASMPPPATPRPAAGRAARTAPVSAGLAPERLTSTADTPALRTRARTRRAAN